MSPVVTVPMFRVICDEAPLCHASPNDGEYYAWSDSGAAMDEALDSEWVVRTHPNGEQMVLCPLHGADVCRGADESCLRRDTARADDGWAYCPDHIEEGGGREGAEAQAPEEGPGLDGEGVPPPQG